jgi:hypothetical protein
MSNKYANSKRKTKSGISELKTKTENGVKIIENDRDKTEVLAEFFSSVFTKEPEGKIPNLQPKETKFRCTIFSTNFPTTLVKLTGL